MTIQHRRKRSGGFTLIEAMCSTFIFLVFVASVSQAMTKARQYSEVQKKLAYIQMDAEHALARMGDELRMSAPISNPIPLEPAYPYVFINGVAEGAFAAESHAPATQNVAPTSPGFGEVREIVFKVPFDNDGNGLCTDDVTGQPEWSTFDVSYVLMTEPSGVNVLVRREDDVVTETIARHVERITFDTVRTDAAVAYNGIVITIYMAEPLAPGVWVEASATTAVTMRNVEEL